MEKALKAWEAKYHDTLLQLEIPWTKALLMLLAHFDDKEGTTYLYSKEDREEFNKQLHPMIAELIDAYHEED